MHNKQHNKSKKKEKKKTVENKKFFFKCYIHIGEPSFACYALHLNVLILIETIFCFVQFLA